jgi:hypothetical protein
VRGVLTVRGVVGVRLVFRGAGRGPGGTDDATAAAAAARKQGCGLPEDCQ